MIGEMGRPLSDAERGELAALCETYSPFDIHGLSGLCCAIGVAPGLVPPSTWLPSVFPDTQRIGDRVGVALDLALRRYSEVMEDLQQGKFRPPHHDDAEACKSFAVGYVAGALLDPEWVDDEASWGLVRDVAYLADRHDLLSADDVADIESEFGPEAKADIRAELRGIVFAAYQILREGDAFDEPEEPYVRPQPKVGRNDPCPCGSGKKFKKCCVDAAVT